MMEKAQWPALRDAGRRAWVSVPAGDLVVLEQPGKKSLQEDAGRGLVPELVVAEAVDLVAT
jgi:hypothetical protein